MTASAAIALCQNDYKAQFCVIVLLVLKNELLLPCCILCILKTLQRMFYSPKTTYFLFRLSLQKSTWSKRTSLNSRSSFWQYCWTISTGVGIFLFLTKPKVFSVLRNLQEMHHQQNFYIQETNLQQQTSLFRNGRHQMKYAQKV